MRGSLRSAAFHSSVKLRLERFPRFHERSCLKNQKEGTPYVNLWLLQKSSQESAPAHTGFTTGRRAHHHARLVESKVALVSCFTLFHLPARGLCNFLSMDVGSLRRISFLPHKTVWVSNFKDYIQSHSETARGISSLLELSGDILTRI